MTMLRVPRSICWNITNQCNDHCSFCYRDTESKPLPLEDNKKILDKIAAEGVTKITFAGGEPLLYPGIETLIQYAKEKGLRTSLTTNGRFLSAERLERIVPYLDWLTMSLDAPNVAVQKAMTRAADHYQVVTKVLTYIQEQQLDVKVKINTVVAKVNQEYVVDMVPLMEQYGVTRWKLFQFTPLRGAAEASEDQFSISSEEFAAVEQQVRDKVASVHGKVKVSPTNSDDLKSGYFTIFPNGDVRVAVGTVEKHCGNVTQDSVHDIWSKSPYNEASHIKRTSVALGAVDENTVEK